MKRQEQIIFDNTCGCIVDEELLSRALIWYADGYPLRTERMIYLQNGYPTVSKGGMQVPVHRLIAMYTQREKIASSMACHHVDGNMLNASVDNLDVMPLGHHASLHRKGTKIAFTEEHIRHMREAQQRRWQRKRRIEK